MQRTGATCEFGINHVGGALFGRALYAPFQCAAEDWRTLGVNSTWDMMPSLRHASDIMAGYWLRGSSNPRGMKYYFAICIQNDETLALIASILLDKAIYDMPAWPGVTLDATEDYWGAKVLLGSPIGATITYLLLQHKAELGIKRITEIIIFKDDDVPGAQIAALWDPEESATNENWIKYKKKGAWLGCLLDATDGEAGKAWPNLLNRNPPSISSEWQGTLESTYQNCSIPNLSKEGVLLSDNGQVSSRRGDGGRASGIKKTTATLPLVSWVAAKSRARSTIFISAHCRKREAETMSATL